MAKIRSQQLNPNFTGSFNVSGSFGITGPLTATTFVGMLSSSAQIESEISGSTTAVSGGLAGRIAIIEGNVGAQDLNTTATPTFDGLNLTNNTSITGSLTVSGDVSGSSTSTGSLQKLVLSETSKTALAIGHQGTDSDQNTVDIRSNDSSTSLRLVSNNDANDYYDAIFRANYNDLNSVELEGPSGRVFLEYRHTGRKTLIGNTAGDTEVVSTKLSGSAASTGSFGRLMLGGQTIKSTTEGIAIVNDSETYTLLSPPAAFQVVSEVDNQWFAYFRNNESTAGRNYGLYVRAGTNSTDSPFKLANKDDSTILRVSGEGTLGINTNSPQSGQKLHVVGDSFFTGNVSGSSTSTGSFGRVETSEFSTSGTSTFSGTNIFTGNVGINSTNPTRALDVVGDIKATGDIIAENYIVSSSVVHLTQSFSSGSTIFGDSADDVHEFVGDTVSGSSTSTGSFGIIELNTGETPGIISFNQGDLSNTVIGYAGTGQSIATSGGRQNTLIGYTVGGQITTGDQNVAIGQENLSQGNSTGNTAVGYRALKQVSTGIGNVGIGRTAGDTVATGNFNIAIGQGADFSGTGATNQIAIGHDAAATADNQTVIGNSSQTQVIFGGDALISGSAASTGSFGRVELGQSNSAPMAVYGVESTAGIRLENYKGYLEIDPHTSTVNITTDKNEVQFQNRIGARYGITGYSTGDLVFYTNSGNTTHATFSHTNGTSFTQNITGSGNLEIAGNISGSSTSTGSFGSVHVPDRIGVDTVTPKSQLHIFRNDSITHSPQNASGGKGILLEQAGSGDAVLEFLTTGETNYIMGIDNSDSDAFKITQGQFRLGDSTTHFRYGRTGRLSLLGTDARLGVGSDPGLQFHVEGFAQISNKTRIGNTGSTTPDAMLDVHGDAIITGSLTTEGNVSGSAASTGSLQKLILSETSKTALAIGHDGTDSDQNTVDIRSNDSSTSLRLVSNNDANDYYDAIFRANYNDLNSVELEGPSGRVFLEYRHTGRKTLIGHNDGNTDVLSPTLSGSAVSTASFGHFIGDGSGLENVFEGTARFRNFDWFFWKIRS